MGLQQNVTRQVVGLLAGVILVLLPNVASAQSDYGQRVPSRDNRWLTPVASRLLSSTEDMHKHRGSVDAWDISAPLGSAIYPMGAGKVIVANCGNAGGYGCWVMVDHGDIKSLYGHMISGSIRVQPGQQVDAWTILGQVGWTGKTSFGPHVHWEIHRGNGGRYRIDQLFDRSLMRKCDFCTAKGEPVAAQGVMTTTGQRSGAGVAWYDWRLLAIFGALMLAYFLTGDTLRWAQHTAMTLYAVVVTAALLLGVSPVGNAGIVGGDAWKLAFAQMRKWEGNSCTHDPVRTFKGVTNTAFNAWRMTKGLTPGDVCRDMTTAQMEAIYYERYWLASGAHKLPAALAITHFDMAVNAGTGVAQGILAQCDINVRCYNDRRELFYRSARDCYLYCAGWLNRLNDIRRLVGG